MIVHFDTGKCHIMPISGRHTICACGQTFQDNCGRYNGRYTTDKDKISCKNCLKKLSKENG